LPVQTVSVLCQFGEWFELMRSNTFGLPNKALKFVRLAHRTAPMCRHLAYSYAFLKFHYEN
jgi:hypothetical protein